MIDTLDEDITRFCLTYSQELGAEYAEARIQEENSQAIIIKNGELQPIAVENSYGIGIRIIYNGSMIFVATNQIQKENIKNLVRDAVKQVKTISEKAKEKIRFDSQSLSISDWKAEEKELLDNVDITTIYQTAKELDSFIDDKGLNINFPSKMVILHTSIENKLQTNSDGCFCRSKVPRLGLTCFLTGSSEGKTVQRVIELGRCGGWESIKELGLHERLIEEREILARIVKESIDPPKGTMDVVLGPEVAGIMAHESIGHPFEADRIIGRESAQAGESYLQPDCLGINIGSPEANVSDDPTLPGSFGFYLYDDEGIKARKRQLLEKGNIKELFHNRATAYEFNTLSNGSSRSVRYDREPIIRMSNTFIEPGDHSFDELVSDVKEGVYIKSFMEWNIDDKRNNQRYVGLEAYEIQYGKIKRLIKNPIIELTTPKLWSSLDARGKDLQFSAATCGKGDPMQGAPVWTGGPHIRLRNVRISSR